MPGPAPITLNPIPTTAAWDGARFTVSYIGRVSNPARDTTHNLDIGHILYSSFGDITSDGWPEIIIAGWTYRPAAGGQMNAPGTALPMPINVISTSPTGATLISSAQLFGVATTAGVSNIRIADFNRDGRNDVYFIGHNEAPFTVVPSILYTSTPNGFSARSGTFLTTSHEAFNGDFNGDGLMDVVMSAYHTQGSLPEIWTTGNTHGNTFYQTSTARPAVLLNLGDGQGGFRTYPIAFDRPNADLTGSNAWQFGNWAGGSASAFADFDNDGRSEIVVSDLFARGANDLSFTYLISNIQFEATSAFGSISRLPAPYFDRDSTYAGATSRFGINKSHDVQILVFDYNNDGLLDILVNSMIWNPGTENGGQDYSITQVLRNDGGLRFTDVTDGVFFNAFMGKQDPGHDSILVDVNGDGFLDLVSTAEPDYVGNQTRPNSHSNEVFINTGDGKFVSAMWSQFGALTEAVNTALVAQGVGRGGFMGTGHTFFPYVRPDGALAFITYENNPRPDGTFDRYFFNVVPDRPMSTGPGGINAASLGAAGFNEAYYLTTYATVATAVQAGQYASGLDHYLAVGRAAGFNGFAKNAQVQGTAGNDVIILREGNEKAFGLAGDDAMQGGLGDDTLDGGAGFDTADYATAASGVTVNLGVTTAQNTGGAGRDTLISIEGVVGSAFADVLIGSTAANTLAGGAGNDVFRGLGGNDVIDGGAGLDLSFYSGVRRQYVGNASGIAGNGEGFDSFVAVEGAVFTDGVLSFDRDGQAAQVMRLYDAALNRTPDGSGFEAVLDLLEGGQTIQQVAAVFLNSPEFQARFGALNNLQFIEQMYRFALRREGDAAGVQVWTDRLNAGASRTEMLVIFSESEEHRNITQATLNQGLWVADEAALKIARMYDATFDRPADSGGLAVWTANLKAGMSMLDIATAFAGSAEFIARYGAVTNEQFIRQMYQFCLNRQPDADGLASWVNALNSGTSRAQMLLNFSESAEHVALMREGWIGGIRTTDTPASPLEDPIKGLDDALVLPPLEDFDQPLVLPADLDDAFVVPADQKGAIVVCLDDLDAPAPAEADFERPLLYDGPWAQLAPDLDGLHPPHRFDWLTA